MFPFRTTPEKQGSFNRFLFASIGQEDHSMPISVLSMFSHLELDAAVEARILLMLPKPNAAERLANHIISLPGTALGDSEARERAKYLVLLLPELGVSGATDRKAPVTFAMLATAWLGSLVAIMAITLVTQWAGKAWRHDPAAPQVTADRSSPMTQGVMSGSPAETRDPHNQSLMRPR